MNIAEKPDPMKVLHDLTPGGSEFYNDPQRCADAIRSSREAMMNALRRAAKRDEQNQATIKQLREALSLECKKHNSRPSGGGGGCRCNSCKVMGVGYWAGALAAANPVLDKREMFPKSSKAIMDGINEAFDDVLEQDGGRK